MNQNGEQRGADQALGLEERAWRDVQRPRFHFVAPGGWLNDPNGVSRWNGTYHLFYQYNPEAPVHGSIHWGHATSPDLVRWRDEPIALTPGDGPDGPDGPDADGCWSGVLVDDGGTPTIVYSGHRDGRERPCLAVGDPELRTWRKDPANPVIAAPPGDLDLVAFRDHCVWRENDEWHQLIGAGIRDVGGTALLYVSDDLRHWRYRGPIHVGDASSRDPVWTGTMWECPELFALGDTDVLVVSVWDAGVTNYPAYFTGSYADGRLTPTSSHVLDYGLRYFYAPQSMQDDSGGRTMFGWLPEGRSESAVLDAGWAGVMSLPRRLLLGADGELVQAPVPEVAALRREHAGTANLDLPPGEALWLGEVVGDQLDIEARLVLDESGSVELAVRCTPDGAERTVVILDRAEGELRLDRGASSLDPDVDTGILAGSLPVGADGQVDLRVVVDHSALEIFANGRALSARVYPSRPDALGVCVGSPGSGNRLERLDAWTMADIWNGPRILRP